MTHEEAISYWFGRINYEVKSAKPSDLKLERMRAFLGLLGRPQDRLRIVHITGTKGKGSTAAMISSVLRTAGYRVGLFTSPHLLEVHERICVDGTPISRRELAVLMSEIAPVVKELEDHTGPTFFEIGTALGFLHFLRRRVDVAVIEVGLGGRYDSTNVCRPMVSVVTSVGLDHMAQLGRTLEEIAYQKAGIIKAGVPVVCGMVDSSARSIIEREAVGASAPLLLVGRDISYVYSPPNRVEIVSLAAHYPAVRMLLRGEHQAANAAVTVGVIERLRHQGLSISSDQLLNGLQTASIPARVEIIRDRPAIILDTAHNVPSAKALVQTLKESFPHVSRKICVFAVSSDKQYPEILTILKSYFDFFYLTRYSNNSRSVPPLQLTQNVPDRSAVMEDASMALSAARSELGENDLLCVTGSVFLAGELHVPIRS